jgi:periodic tryptophan protein 1
VARGECKHTLTHHKDKVQAAVWNPAMASVLLTGGFDHVAAVADVRTPGGAVLSWAVTADVECAAWNPAVAEQFLVSTEDGHVTCHDARRGGGAAALFTLAAHGECPVFAIAARQRVLTRVRYPFCPSQEASSRWWLY